MTDVLLTREQIERELVEKAHAAPQFTGIEYDVIHHRIDKLLEQWQRIPQQRRRRDD